MQQATTRATQRTRIALALLSLLGVALALVQSCSGYVVSNNVHVHVVYACLCMSNVHNSTMWWHYGVREVADSVSSMEKMVQKTAASSNCPHPPTHREKERKSVCVRVRTLFARQFLSSAHECSCDSAPLRCSCYTHI
jgi:hypothetical protein